MQRRTFLTVTAAAALALAGFALGDGKPGWGPPELPSYPNATTQPATQPTTQPTQAVDLGNTVCPVSGDKVGDSKIVEVYEGKVYHMCCDSCPKDFEKDPGKYAAAVAADPAKYGVK